MSYFYPPFPFDWGKIVITGRFCRTTSNNLLVIDVNFLHAVHSPSVTKRVLNFNNFFLTRSRGMSILFKKLF